MALACKLDIHGQTAQVQVGVVESEGVVLLPLIPMAHHNERYAYGDAIVGYTLKQQFVGFRLVLLGFFHVLLGPFVGAFYQFANGQLAMGRV